MAATETEPHAKRRGMLRNGNPPGDFSKAARCGARTRRGSRCGGPAMPNGRCRMHGGLSTGPKTLEGLERIRRASTRHGRYTAGAKAERRKFASLIRDSRVMLGRLLILFVAVAVFSPFGFAQTEREVADRIELRLQARSADRAGTAHVRFKLRMARTRKAGDGEQGTKKRAER